MTERFVEHADDHESDRRRDDRAHDVRGGGQRRGEARRIAFLHHRRDEYPAERARVGHRRARDAGHEGRRRDVAHREPAAEPPEDRVRESEEAIGHPAGGHQVAGEQEERDGEEQQAVDAGDDLLRDDHQVDPADPQDRDHRRGDEAERHRDREHHQHRDGDEQDPGDRHGGPRTPRRERRGTARRRGVRRAPSARSAPCPSAARRKGSSSVSPVRPTPAPR